MHTHQKRTASSSDRAVADGGSMAGAGSLAELAGRVHELQGALDRQNELISRWRKVAHNLNNLFLVLGCEVDSQHLDPSVGELIARSAAELRTVSDASRAINPG